MVDLTREDVARFLAAWRRAYLPTGLLTPQVQKVVEALETLTVAGGIICVDDVTAPLAELTPPLASIDTADDIPF